MRNQLFLVFMTGSLFLCGGSKAQTLQKIKDEGLSPFTTKAKYILLTGGVLTLSALPLKRDDIQEDAAEHKPLGRYSKFGDYAGQLVPNILYGVGMYLHYKFRGDLDSKRRAIFMTKATAYSAAMTTVIKYAVRERRPDHSARNSFPSGHATTIFAFASVIGIEHEWYYAVPAYALGAFVGYSRLNDNKHYLADMIAGATIGMSYGYGIRAINQKDPSSMSFLVPSPDMKGLMLGYGKTFE